VQVQVESEALAYWYLRLNGYLTTTNFVIHPDEGRNQETDADVLGVRFPYRAENMRRPMKDDPSVVGAPGKVHIVIAEVKSGICALNGPWTKPERKNMVRVLRAIGVFHSKEADTAAKALYETGKYSGSKSDVSLLCFGRDKSDTVSQTYPAVPQITWNQALTFIFNRFREYRREKSSHPQWDKTGHTLWNASDATREVAVFLQQVSVR